MSLVLSHPHWFAVKLWRWCFSGIGQQRRTFRVKSRFFASSAYINCTALFDPTLFQQQCPFCAEHDQGALRHQLHFNHRILNRCYRLEFEQASAANCWVKIHQYLSREGTFITARGISQSIYSSLQACGSQLRLSSFWHVAERTFQIQDLTNLLNSQWCGNFKAVPRQGKQRQ